MKKSIKTLGLLALTGMLAVSQGATAFAATKTPGSGRSELSTYNAELATQRSKLSGLITESKELSAGIKEAQASVRQSGYMTKSASEELTKLSGDIKAKRQELTGERGSNKTLRAAAKDARMSGDIDSAKDQLLQLSAVQEKQIKIRTELIELLEKKLAYLNAMNGTETAAYSTSDTAAVDAIVTDSNGEAVQSVVDGAASETAAGEVNEAAADNAASVEADIVAVGTSGEVEFVAAEDEIVTDESIIEAAFDDGEELEDSDY